MFVNRAKRGLRQYSLRQRVVVDVWAVLGGSGWRERVESDWQIWALFQAVDKTQTSCAGKYEPFSGSAHARPVHAAAWAGHRTSDCKAPENALPGRLILTLHSEVCISLRDIGCFFLDMCRQYSGCSKITSSQKLGRSLVSSSEHFPSWYWEKTSHHPKEEGMITYCNQWSSIFQIWKTVHQRGEDNLFIYRCHLQKFNSYPPNVNGKIKITHPHNSGTFICNHSYCSGKFSYSDNNCVNITV